MTAPPSDEQQPLKLDGIITPEQARQDVAPEGAKPEEPKRPETDWRAESRKWEQRAKENKDAAGRLAEIEKANQTEYEKAVKAAYEEGKSEVLTAANQRLIQAEVRALAASQGFRDPHDAIAQLRDRLGDVAVTDDGVDVDALRTALTDLSTAKPYLLQDNKPGAPAPDPGQGARINSPEALADAEYHKFYPPAKR